MSEPNLNRIHELLLEAMRAEQASLGMVLRYRPGENELHAIAHVGFSEKALSYFRHVKPFDSTCCGRAFGAGIPVVITDVERDIGFRPNLEMAKAAGFRSVKSVPVINAKGEKIGVVSTHFREPKTHWNMGLIDRFLPEFTELLDLRLQLSDQI